MKATHCFLASLVVLAAHAGAEPALLRTAQPLDEPRGYCLDIAGFGASLRLDEPLQAHSCKYGTPLEDQLFEAGPRGAIEASRYDRCLSAGALERGAKLFARPCAGSSLQRWSLDAGSLRPVSRPELCATLPKDAGEPAGTPRLITPVYRRQDLTLERCDAAARARQEFRWSPARRARQRQRRRHPQRHARRRRAAARRVRP